MIGRFSGSWTEGLEFREEEVAAPSRLTCLYLLSYLQVSRILNIIIVMSIKNKLETSVSNLLFLHISFTVCLLEPLLIY